MPTPEFRHSQTILLAGTMVLYNSQAEATEKIPAQWADLLARPVPELHTARSLYGASPCTDDHKLHYFTGIEVPNYEGVNSPARLTIEDGEYAVFTVENIADLRSTWTWALSQWLPSSGRKERNAPEFERYTAPYNPERASGPIGVWIPLEPQGTL
jgi:AraC family transcriptional regulator